MTYPEKLKGILALVVTLSSIYLLEDSWILPIVLVSFWAILFFCPWKRSENIIFLIASLFFLIQNYFVLKSGGFFFKHKDILLMPYYEPFLWGFYYLAIKRFIADPMAEILKLDWRSFVGLGTTAVCFALFSTNSNLLLLSTLISTCILFSFFHEKYDFYYAATALVLGFAVEIFGVTTGLWWYPKPDFLGIPYWFATMWISVGILGRRFLIPLSIYLSKLF